ncbi:hypothetical protein ACFPIJ_61915 [Dactylosporangium cerinum]|uniref:Uncharacterized protein n=1 Tax=Dactylosporangium cerinum TaxID=1434730 RepID=A0ABV9WKT8_9ACTN
MSGPDPELAAMGTGDLTLAVLFADERLRDAFKQFIDQQIMLSFVADEGVVPDEQDPRMRYIKELRRRLRVFRTEFYEKHVCACPCHDEDPPGDPAGDVGDAIGEQPTETVTAAVPVREDPPVPAWRVPIDELLASNIGHIFLDGWTVPDTEHEALHHVHIALLRLPAVQRDSWTKKLAAVTPASGGEPPVLLPAIEGEMGRLLVPGTPGRPGILSSPGHVLPPMLQRELELEFDPAVAQLLNGFAALVAQVSHLAGLDTTLREAVTDQITRKFKNLLSGGVASKYQTYVFNRFRDLAKAVSPTDRLRNAVRLDEALRSLVHAPISADSSWWGMLRLSSYGLVNRYVELATRAGHTAEIDLLSGAYEDAYLRGHCDPAKDATAPPGPERRDGEIAACLRLYLRIDDEQSKGRVLYYE